MSLSFAPVGRALRPLRREPAFAAAVVVVFALAIGTTAALFGIVSRLMLSPPAGVRAGAQVARANLRWSTDDGETFVASTASYPLFTDLRVARSSAATFRGVAAERADTVVVGATPDVRRVSALGVTGDYFTLLGARAALGRVVTAGDDAPPAGSDVVVLGHDFWRANFAGRASVVGETVLIDDRRFTVVGVAERGFHGTGQGAVDLYLPLAAMLRDRGEWRTTRGMNLVEIVARVADGVPFATAEARASDALAAAAREYGAREAPVVTLSSLRPSWRDARSAEARIALWLAGVSLVVLLIATANVGTLFALRAARRSREIAVRLALGARPARLARTVIAECLLLAGIGAAVGAMLAGTIAGLVRATLLPGIARDAVLVDARIVVLALLLAVPCALLVSLAPLAVAWRKDVGEGLRAAGGYGTSTRLVTGRLLLTVQTALSFVLVGGAALFVRSLDQVQSQELGLTVDDVLYATVDFRGYVAAVERDMVHDELLRAVRAIPGTKATLVAGIPFGPHMIPPVSVPGMTEPPNVGGQIPIMYAATPEYLELMGVTLVSGRGVASTDTRGAPLVLLVNETMARTVWPGRSPLGQCVRIGFAPGASLEAEGNPADGAPCRQVIGVVRDSRARSLRGDGNESRLMQYYVPFEQLPDAPIPDQPHAMGMLLRGDGSPGFAARAQRAMTSASPLPVFVHVRPYQELIDPQLRSWRLGATLFTALGLFALAIAAVGLFGVVSYLVAGRRRELGVRFALGGTRARITRLVVFEALRLAGGGIVVGMGAALLAAPLVAPLLYRVSSRDPISLLTAAAILVLTTLAAAALPARRAGAVDPLEALRAD